MAPGDPAPDWNAAQVIEHLRGLSSARNVDGMARYGIATETALGVPNSILRPLARSLKRDHARATELWASGIREARIFALFTDEPRAVTADQARHMADDFDSWEIVDHAANLFCEAGLAFELAPEFASDEREFVRRAAFAMMAWSAVHLKSTPDGQILSWLPLIERHAGDNRNFVRKAVSWALRQIGKRSPACHGPAVALAETLAASDDRSRRWIGKDAVKELTAQKTLERLKKKAEPAGSTSQA